MASTTTLLTADDLELVPGPDLPHELWRGVLRLVTYTAPPHGSVSARLLGALAQYVYAHELGTLFSEGTGFLLERDPDTVFCPDVAFLRKERLPPGGLAELRLSSLVLVPDLAVEVLSPNDRPAMVRAKIAEYLRLGVRAVWMIDPKARAVRIHSRDGDRLIETRFAAHDTLDGGEVVPGWRCPVAALFADL